MISTVLNLMWLWRTTPKVECTLDKYCVSRGVGWELRMRKSFCSCVTYLDGLLIWLHHICPGWITIITVKITKYCYCSLQACWCVYSWGGDLVDKGQADSAAVSVYRAVPSPATCTEGKTEALPACFEAWKGDTLWVEQYLILRSVAKVNDTFLIG